MKVLTAPSQVMSDTIARVIQRGGQAVAQVWTPDRGWIDGGNIRSIEIAPPKGGFVEIREQNLVGEIVQMPVPGKLNTVARGEVRAVALGPNGMVLGVLNLETGQMAEVPIGYVTMDKATLRCRAKECTYFQHYLAYGPADLTHEGYHAAEKICADRQQMVDDFYNTHPNATDLPASLKRLVEAAEVRIRA